MKAEEFFGKLAQHEKIKDRIVPLAWHVDYWDRLGWKDTFGSKKYTMRQKLYAAKHKARGLVTPQFVIDNNFSRKLGASINEALKEAQKVDITCTATLDKGAIEANINLKKTTADGTVGPNFKVIPILFQRKATTHCKTGENKGKTLVEWFPVLEALAPTSVEDALAKGVTAKFTAPKGVKVDNLGVAVLVEDPRTLNTLECRAFKIEKK